MGNERRRWISAAPTEEGWYWWRKRKGKTPEISYVHEAEDGSGRMIRDDVDEVIVGGSGEWWGPIDEPRSA